ncbi:MAG: phytoene desaturase family protein [Burkholderiales bacterium]
MRTDGIVIGAGVNELACAHYLARSGRRVVVLERGNGADAASPETGWVPPRIARDLELERHGLAIYRPDPWAAAALADGGRLELWHDMARSVEAIRRLSPKDAAKWPEFCERMARLARLLEALYLAAPPKPTSRGLGDLARLAGLGLRLRRLGRQGIEDLLRLLPMSVADLLDDWFESDALKGVLGAAGVMHLRQGPRSGGTAFLFLHHHVGSPAGVFRPPASNIGRVLRELAGVEIRHGAEVARINAREGRATGVALSGGEEIVAPLIVSGADPRRTLLGLVDPGALDPDFVRAVRNIRCRGVVARVTLALDRAPGFSTLVVAPSLDYLERAYDDAKYGRVSKKPYLEARCSDEKRVEVHMQYVPHEAATGDGLGDIVAQMLTEHLNRAVIAERRVHSPRDLEKLEGFPEGQAHHAELALDQALWMRPVPELAHYRTPVEGLFLCGPGMHPGGGIAGAAGYNCAQELAKGL